jgi:hypothetical protein
VVLPARHEQAAPRLDDRVDGALVTLFDLDVRGPQAAEERA